jgi:hypothetical protein
MFSIINDTQFLLWLFVAIIIKIALDIKNILSGDEGQQAIAVKVGEKKVRSTSNPPVVLIVGAGAAGLSV